MIGSHLRYTDVPGWLACYYACFGLPYIGLHIKQMALAAELPRMRSAWRILDAGCGQGWTALWLAGQLPQAKIVAADIDASTIEQARTLQQKACLSNLSFEQADLCRLEWQETFDLILSLDVLEHVVDDRLMLAQLQESLVLGGRLLVHVPLRHQLQQRTFGHWAPWSHPDHVRDEYTPDEIRQRIEETGLVIEAFHFTYGGLSIPLWEIGTVLRLRYLSLNLLIFPVLRLICRVIYRARYARGNGMLIWARKSG